MPQTLKDTIVSDLPQGAGTPAPVAPRPSLAARAEEAGRPQPVCLETPVTVSGVRAVEGSDKREPFTEATSTVLVFAKGAVLRLSFPLNPGQLLFLTNSRTNKETVCQVVKSKAYKNVSGYVEVEFTEPSVGFWGMRFPGDPIGAANANSASAVGTRDKLQELEARYAANQLAGVLPVPAAVTPRVEPLTTSAPAPSLAPAKAQSGAASDLRVASTPAPIAIPTAAPKTPAAPELVAEIHALLATDKTARASESSLPLEPQVATLHGLDAKPARSQSFSAKLEEEGLPIPTWFDPSRSAKQSVARYGPAAVTSEQKEKETADEVTPVAMIAEKESAVLETHLTPPWVKEAASAPARPARKGFGLAYAAIVVVLVLAGAAGFWYYRQSSSAPQQAAPAVRTVPVARPVAPPAAPPAASASLGTEEPPASGTKSVDPTTAAPVATSSSVHAATSAVRQPASISPKSTAVTPKELPAAKKPVLPSVRMSKPNAVSKAPVATNPEADGNLAAGLGEVQISGDASTSTFASSQPAAPATPQAPAGGDLQPAHAISTVPPTYPAIAMSQNITGDVQLDALIGPDGRVGKMRVISGPMLLQQAAKDALSRWRYAPATLDGKPTEMHVTVTIRFRVQH